MVQCLSFDDSILCRAIAERGLPSCEKGQSMTYSLDCHLRAIGIDSTEKPSLIKQGTHNIIIVKSHHLYLARLLSGLLQDIYHTESHSIITAENRLYFGMPGQNRAKHLAGRMSLPIGRNRLLAVKTALSNSLVKTGLALTGVVGHRESLDYCHRSTFFKPLGKQASHLGGCCEIVRAHKIHIDTSLTEQRLVEPDIDINHLNAPANSTYHRCNKGFRIDRHYHKRINPACGELINESNLAVYFGLGVSAGRYKLKSAIRSGKLLGTLLHHFEKIGL